MKVYVQQGSTTWESEFSTIDEFDAIIAENPFNAKNNEYIVTTDEGELVAENVYFLGMEEEEVIYTSEELNNMNGVPMDRERIIMALTEEGDHHEY